MAPIASTTANTSGQYQIGKTVYKGILDIKKLKLTEEQIKEEDENYEFNHLRPSLPKVDWPALEVFDVGTDKGLLADPSANFKNLFRDATSVTHINHKIGTEVVGVNLANLDDVQKNELALLLATRIAVIFRDQKDLDINKQLELGRYFGKLHKHATTEVPRQEGLEEVHVVWTDETNVPYNGLPATYHWHSDISYELQPPSYTSLKLLKGPSTNGDTAWISGYAVYDLLSSTLQKYLESHTALHSAFEQARAARERGSHVRREPILTEHPIVRVHPVTGYKSVYVNPGFTRSIVGVPKAESDAILKYLFEIIATNQEATVRFKWDAGDVVYWDNRNSVHSASYGFYPQRRHAVRVTTHGEVPYYDEKGKSQQAEIDEILNSKTTYDQYPEIDP